MFRKMFKYVPLLVFGVLAVSLWAGAGSETANARLGYLDRPLPDFNSPPMAGTDTGFSHHDLAGEVAMINVFASWCAVCKQEHPFLMNIASTTDVPVYGLNWKDKKGGGKLFLTREGDPYVAIGDDNAGTLGKQLNVTGVPETYIVDKNGQIRYRHIGPITQEIWMQTLWPLIKSLRGQT